VKQLIKGTVVFLPVFTAGALFSIGDAHFAQGDGEVCGSAIEMAASFHLRFLLHEGAARERNIRGVQFAGMERASTARRYYATIGLSMRGEEVQESEDATLAARNALLAMIDYLQQRGYNRQQAYAISSVVVDLRVSEVVDVPNFVVTAIFAARHLRGVNTEDSWPSFLPFREHFKRYFSFYGWKRAPRAVSVAARCLSWRCGRRTVAPSPVCV
jgi:formamidase